jgi:dephospho-CoA kinase
MRDVVDSIRNPAEVEVLRGLPHFILLGVRAAVEKRFRRSLERARPGDPMTLAEFRRREQQENSKDPVAQQLEATFALADHCIENDGDFDALRQAIDERLAALVD